jgi:hypothetical protein
MTFTIYLFFLFVWMARVGMTTEMMGDFLWWDQITVLT